MYLYHLLAQFLVWQVLLPGIEHWNKWLKYGLRCLLYFGITFGLSVVSYTVIERRFLRLKDRLR
jgi:peptidoglycan/LPS O-acetylase OafA/YrhL